MTGTPPRLGQRKGDDQTGEEAEETGLRRGAAGVDRDLRSRSRAARQRAQRQAVEAGRSGRLCDKEIQYRTRIGRIGSKNIDVAEAKGSG